MATALTSALIPFLAFLGPSTPQYVPYSAPVAGDNAELIADEVKYFTLTEMKAQKLEQAALARSPWSGWYWPLNEGGLAYRYADPDFPRTTDWPNIEKYLSNTVGKGAVDNFSPAEKYDLLLGNTDFTLTRNMIMIASDYAIDGKIDAWMGYCTGWANASMMMPRPTQSVTVLAADGKTKILFRPSDIKALGALLWANGSFPWRIAGTLCTESPVRRDPTTGRALDPQCRDTNPATWHLSVVNQIGVSRRSLLIESDSGYQVWNQPVQSYTYKYFNPASGAPGSLEDSAIERSNFTNDKFAPYRDPRATKIVGIEMQLTFIYESRPDTGTRDDGSRDEKRVPVYRYDLELDSSGRIIGGEWHSRLHPDLLWVAPIDAFPAVKGDELLANDDSRWKQIKPLPQPWIEAAKNSIPFTQPLGRIVKQLFEWSTR